MYSITFDEALSDLHRFAVPTLDEFGIPGHLEVVVGQLGQVRAIGNSTYNGMRHMDGAELRDMIERGWGVGNHSWSHQQTNAENAELELLEAKQVLEEAIDHPIVTYCSSGSNSNMNDSSLAACRVYGYLNAMSITDALNRPDDDNLLWLNRTFLHEQGYAPFFSEFDPFRNIQHARRDRGWVIDYLHCPLEQALHPNKDCSAAHLRERIETVCSEGGQDVWLANIEHAADYRYTRRHARLETFADNRYRLSAPTLPDPVQRRVLTLKLGPGFRAVVIDGRCVAGAVRPSTGLYFDVEIDRPHDIELIPA